MADGAVPVDLRMIIATWPADAPRGARARFCARHGVSTSTFDAIRARARAEGAAAAAVPRSRRPRSPAGQTPAALEDIAVRIRKELTDDGWDAGPVSVRAAMLARGLPAPSRATLARIFSRRGMVVPQPAKRPRSSWRRFSYGAPNECWQLDGTAVSLADGTAVMVLQIIDDHSRRLLASLAAPGETSEAALAVVGTAIGRVGAPQRFLSDNGTAFNLSRRGKTAALEHYLRSLGVQPIAASPYHPQTCGKNERVHATLKRWLGARPRPADLPALQALLNQFDLHYNTVRPHQALSGLTPQAAWDATTLAAAPTPPAPTATRAPAPRIHRNRVGPNGNVGAGISGVVIHVGKAHAGTTVYVITDPDTITVLDLAGRELRRATREPGHTYYGNGLPRGRGRTQPTNMS